MAHFGNIICVENGPLIHGNDTLFPGLDGKQEVKKALMTYLGS